MVHMCLILSEDGALAYPKVRHLLSQSFLTYMETGAACSLLSFTAYSLNLQRAQQQQQCGQCFCYEATA